MDPTSDFAVLIQSGLLHGAAVFLRIGAAATLLPAFGERSVPSRVRLAIALAFTAIVAPAVAPFPVPGNVPALLGLLGSETLVGLVLGLILRLFVMALQIAGSMIAQSTSLAQLMGGAAAEPLPAVGHVLVVGGLALAVIAGLHIRIAGALIDSYRSFPPGQLLSPGMLADFGTAQIAASFALAFTLAAPFVVSAFVYNLALGAINRAMPQLMVVLVGAPAITGGGLMVLALAAPFLLQIWWAAFDARLADPFGLR